MDNLEHVSASNTQNDRIIPDPQPVAVDQSPRVTIDQLLMAGAHFGHLTQRWNPKMKKFIFSALNGIYIIDLLQTQQLIDNACRVIAGLAAKGEEILFVGTKKAARDIVEAEAKRAECPFVTYRWLGGTLTNFTTIRRSVKTLETYEKMATDGTYENISKKEQLSVEKEKQKLLRTLGGIRDMRRLPGAIFIVDVRREAIAVAEARKLKIPIVAIVDTNVDPDVIDYPIPANDDAFKSIWLVARAISDAVSEGKSRFKEERTPEERLETKDRQRPRRPRRRRRSKGHDRTHSTHEGSHTDKKETGR